MLSNPDMPWEEYNYCSTVIHLIRRFCHTQTDHLFAPLMRWYAIKTTYQGMVSTRGTLTHSSSLSPSLSLALSLSAVDGGDVKVDRWGWQPDNRLLSSASVPGLSLPCIPCNPLSSTSSYGHVLSLLLFTPFPHQRCSSYLCFFHFLPQLPLSARFPIFLLFALFHPVPHSLHSFTQCHYGPHANRGLH